MNQPLLSVMVPTTPDRCSQFSLLWDELNKQADGLPVELFFDDEDKHLSIGLKRDRMYKKANGLFSVQWDSDDWIKNDGIRLIIDAIRSNPEVDCITYYEAVTIDGIRSDSCFSLQYFDWHENPTYPTGFKYARTPFFKTPIKTNLCKQIGVNNIRFGEDHDFAQRIKPLLHEEVHIPEFIYMYNYKSSPFEERYGIKNK